MKNSKTHVTKLVFLAMMVALGVVISPILRVEGMCPMAHFINVTCAVMLGPWYAFVCALAIGIIRMVCMGIPPGSDRCSIWRFSFRYALPPFQRQTGMCVHR